MEAELRNLAVVAAATGVALWYSYAVTCRLPTGKPRLLSVFPVILLFALTPLSFSTLHLKVISVFTLTWLASFKLLLLAFQRGPLSDRRLPLPSFLALAALPVQTRGDAGGKPHKAGAEAEESSSMRELPVPPAVEYACKVAVLVLILSLYPERHRYPRAFILALYGAHVYLALDLILAAAALAARPALLPGMSLQPQFAPPYLATSLRDFWSRRWNLAASQALRAAVYTPVRARLGPATGLAATFLVSGAVHEAVYCYLTGNGPSGETAAFFAVQGLGVAAETVAKEALRRKGWCQRPLPRVLSALLTLGFIFVTGVLILIPPLVRSGLEEVTVGECLAAVEAARAALESPKGFGAWTI